MQDGAGTIPRWALIIGAMKAGTTSLYAYLAQHPQVAGCEPKEPDFFSDDDVWRRGAAWYHSRFAFDPTRHEVALEASTSYTKQPRFTECVGRMRSFGGDLRFLYVVRDPVARIESHYRYMLRQVQGPSWRRGALEHGRLRRIAIAYSDYAMQLAPYEETFGRRAIHVIDQAHLLQDPKKTLDGILRFLDLDPFTFPDLERRLNQSADHRAVRPAWHALWRASGRNPKVKALVRRSEGTKVDGLFRTGKAPAFRLPEPLRDEVHERLRFSMEHMHRTYGIDIRAWGF